MKRIFFAVLVTWLCGVAWGQSLLPNAQQQFTDLNGQPLANGQVYFYIPGTTQAKYTYQDQAETVPNTNPVLLDSGGRATVWGIGVYREVVYDQYGNLVWDGITYGGTAVTGAGGFGAAIGVASGSTVDLGVVAPAGHNVSITGTTTINSFGSSADASSPIYLLRFTGSLQLTNSGAIALPTGANITTAAGDVATAEYLGSGNWRVREYYRATGQALALGASGVTPGAYTLSSVTVDTYGRVTSASSGSNAITLTGDVTGSGALGGSVATTLANSGVVAGTYSTPNLTVNSKGQITSASSAPASVELASGNVDTGGTSIKTISLASYTGYTRFAVMVDNLTGASGVLMQASADGGSSWYTTANYIISGQYCYAANPCVLFGTAGTGKTNWDVANSGNSPTNVTINLYNFKGATSGGKPSFSSNGESVGAVFMGAGNINDAAFTSANAIKLYAPSGAVTGGTYRVIGYP